MILLEENTNFGRKTSVDSQSGCVMGVFHSSPTGNEYYVSSALSAGQNDIGEVGEMWKLVFVWCLGSSLFVYGLASLLAFIRLKNHKYGRWYAVLVLLMGIINPLITGTITSGFIAFVYSSADTKMSMLHAMLWGFGLTVVGVGFGFLRALPTL